MIRYKCASCGRVFNPEKHEICPRCGDAVAPSVLTRIERKLTAQRLRAEGKFNYDEHCHEDDAWTGSYGAGTHRAAVRSHEASLRARYAAHSPADNPTRVSNANPAAQTPARPIPGAQSIPGTQIPVRTAAPGTEDTRGKTRQKPKLGWIWILWILYLLYRIFLK